MAGSSVGGTSRCAIVRCNTSLARSLKAYPMLLAARYSYISGLAKAAPVLRYSTRNEPKVEIGVCCPAFLGTTLGQPYLPSVFLAVTRKNEPEAKSNLAEYLQTISKLTAEYAETARGKIIIFKFSAAFALSAVLG